MHRQLIDNEHYHYEILLWYILKERIRWLTVPCLRRRIVNFGRINRCELMHLFSLGGIFTISTHCYNKKPALIFFWYWLDSQPPCYLTTVHTDIRTRKHIIGISDLYHNKSPFHNKHSLHAPTLESFVTSPIVTTFTRPAKKRYQIPPGPHQVLLRVRRAL